MVYDPGFLFFTVDTFVIYSLFICVRLNKYNWFYSLAFCEGLMVNTLKVYLE
jgi:hypothetical protein